MGLPPGHGWWCIAQWVLLQSVVFGFDLSAERVMSEKFHDVARGSSDINRVLREELGIHAKNTTNKDGKCNENEIYIIDGERSLLLTNKRIAHDLSDIKQTHANLVSQIKSDDQIIFFLKQRLNNSEAKVDATMEVMKAQEQSHKRLMGQINGLRYDLDTAKSENVRLSEAQEQTSQTLSAAQMEINELKFQLKEKDNRLEELRRKVSGVANNKTHYTQREVEKCKAELGSRVARERDFQAQLLEAEERLHECQDQVVFKGDEKANNECRLIRDQMQVQDKTIILLKEQIKAQGKAMGEINMLVDKRRTVMEALSSQMSLFASAQETIHNEMSKKEDLITKQFQTIDQLKSVKQHEDEYRTAKDQALKILQNTVFQMVGRVRYCASEAVKGLQQEVAVLREQQKPTERLIAELRETISNSAALKQYQSELKNVLLNVMHMKNESVWLLREQAQKILDMRELCEGKCQATREPLDLKACMPVCDNSQSKSIQRQENPKETPFNELAQGGPNGPIHPPGDQPASPEKPERAQVAPMEKMHSRKQIPQEQSHGEQPPHVNLPLESKPSGVPTLPPPRNLHVTISPMDKSGKEERRQEGSIHQPIRPRREQQRPSHEPQHQERPLKQHEEIALFPMKSFSLDKQPSPTIMPMRRFEPNKQPSPTIMPMRRFEPNPKDVTIEPLKDRQETPREKVTLPPPNLPKLQRFTLPAMKSMREQQPIPTISPMGNNNVHRTQEDAPHLPKPDIKEENARTNDGPVTLQPLPPKGKSEDTDREDHPITILPMKSAPPTTKDDVDIRIELSSERTSKGPILPLKSVAQSELD